MKTAIVALPGFLGCSSDWEAVRVASKSDLTWICPDLFARGEASWEPPHGVGPCWLAGYSFGARLALAWMQKDPSRWLGALLLSVNPGNFQTDAERTARRQADEAWAASFEKDAWSELLARWNNQAVLAGSPAPQRDESHFDRAKLAAALRTFSAADQFTDPLRLPPRLIWMAGARDGKFLGLQTSMRDAGFPGSFLVVEGAGHRLLAEAPQAVAASLDDLVA
ncbi:MAG: alpha/beta fold hydrolase [Chthoniobacterales bacterium]